MEKRNISGLSIGALVEKLAGLYCSAIRIDTAENGRKKEVIPGEKGGKMLTAMPSAFLWGPPGIGKSDGVEQIAEKIRKETGKKVHVTDIRLLLFSPVDLRGVPMADASRQFTEWLRPKIFDLDPGEDVINLLFLDELSAAPPSVQAAAYQITLNRTVGEHALPDNCIILAAGNRTSDRSVAYRMPNALANRMMHFEVKVDFDSWRQWGVKHGIHPFVLGYLSYDNSKLCTEEPELDEVAFPTPRSWSFVSTLLYSMEGQMPHQLHELISGCIGIGTALEFEAWCSVYEKLPSTEAIFEGRTLLYPKMPDVLYALISSMTVYTVEHAETISPAALERGCSYANHFPVDFATMFYRNLLEIEGLNLKLMKVPSFQTWMKKNKRYINSSGGM